MSISPCVAGDAAAYTMPPTSTEYHSACLGERVPTHNRHLAFARHGTTATKVLPVGTPWDVAGGADVYVLVDGVGIDIHIFASPAGGWAVQVDVVDAARDHTVTLSWGGSATHVVDSCALHSAMPVMRVECTRRVLGCSAVVCKPIMRDIVATVTASFPQGLAVYGATVSKSVMLLVPHCPVTGFVCSACSQPFKAIGGLLNFGHRVVGPSKAWAR